MNGSDVTVVIPTYRRPKLLARALSSVIRQEIPGLRIHVFDNASGDETPRVVRELGRRHPVAYTCNEANVGITRNFQIAIGSIETAYCCILNDDDMQLPGLISSALAALPAHPAAGAFCGRTMVYSPGSGGRGPTTRVQGASWQPGLYRAAQATAHMVREHFTPTGVVFSTRALQGAKFEFGDVEMMARVAEQHDIVVSDRIFGVYVFHPRGWSASHSPDEGRSMLLRRLHDYLELETLSGEERRDAVLRVVGELMNAQYWHSLSATFHGERTSPLRRDIAQSAAMSIALTGKERAPGELFALVMATALAGRSEAPMSRTRVRALRVLTKLGGVVDRIVTGPRRRSEAEDAALAEIAALDRSAEALFEALQTGPPAG